jgi:hypothetical protein
MVSGVNYKIYEYVRHVFTALFSIPTNDDLKGVFNTVER